MCYTLHMAETPIIIPDSDDTLPIVGSDLVLAGRPNTDTIRRISLSRVYNWIREGLGGGGDVSAVSSLPSDTGSLA